MRHIFFIIRYFITMVFTGMAGRTMFYLFNGYLIRGGGEMIYSDMLLNGLRLDLAVAGYITIIPALLRLMGVCGKGERMRKWIMIYNFFIFVLYSIAILANIVLYRYWGFPLDSTPLFYLMSSPADAMASITGIQILTGAFILFVMTYCFMMVMMLVTYEVEVKASKDKWVDSLLVVLTAALLFIPIRGGFSVAVNNVGSVYFSDNVRLNHAAVNPVFSFLESVTHENDFAGKYRYLDDKEAEKLFSKMTYTKMRSERTADLLPLSEEFVNALEKKDKGVNVVMVILESFSKKIMTGEGGELQGVTPTLDELTCSGIYFDSIYANSFRTDRGLMAILSGFPAQPTMSLMKYPRKTNDIYAISRSLKNAGYNTRYIYGGDANFTNMRSYLMATGFDSVISEEDYDKSLRTSKWGVNDSVLFSRALVQIEAEGTLKNTFRVIQTSSSHEPFDVPHKALDDKVLNAFHYTDECLGNFIASLEERNDWDRTLLVIVPDHLGCYPEDIDNFQLYRYEIPLILSGGAVKEARRISTIGSQQDIAATLLAILGIDHSDFLYSKDLLDSKAPHFAFFTVPDAVGMVTKDNSMIFDNTSKKAVVDIGKKGANLRSMQAYLQKLYDDIARR